MNYNVRMSNDIISSVCGFVFCLCSRSRGMWRLLCLFVLVASSFQLSRGLTQTSQHALSQLRDHMQAHSFPESSGLFDDLRTLRRVAPTQKERSLFLRAFPVDDLKEPSWLLSPSNLTSFLSHLLQQQEPPSTYFYPHPCAGDFAHKSKNTHFQSADNQYFLKTMRLNYVHVMHRNITHIQDIANRLITFPYVLPLLLAGPNFELFEHLLLPHHTLSGLLFPSIHHTSSHFEPVKPFPHSLSRVTWLDLKSSRKVAELFEPYNSDCTSYGQLVRQNAASFSLPSSIDFEKFHENMKILFEYLNATNVDDYSIAVAFFDPKFLPLLSPTRCYHGISHALRSVEVDELEILPLDKKNMEKGDTILGGDGIREGRRQKWKVEVKEGEEKEVGFCIAIVDTFMRMADFLPSSSMNLYGYPKFHSYSFSMTCLTILLFGQKAQGLNDESIKGILLKIYGEETVHNCEYENGKLLQAIHAN